MPLATFTPPMRPSPGTGYAPEIALNETSFGDGYKQSSPKGLNHIRRVVQLKWDYLILSEARQIEAFLVQHGGYLPFYYTLNGESAARKWICKEWSITEGTPTKVSITIREAFTTQT